MAELVDRYGVHWAPGKIAFLHQTRGGLNAIGLKEPSPFTVKILSKRMCNHLIALNAVNPARSHLMRFEPLIAKDSLVRFMLPLPKDGDRGVGTVQADQFDPDLLDIVLLTKFSSPIKTPIFWMSLTSPRAVLDELAMTDVQPLVLAGVEAKHTEDLAKIMRAAAHLPRRLLVVHAPDVPVSHGEPLTAGYMASQDMADLVSLPWETMGAKVLNAYMRREWNVTWFTREPIPGNEAKFNGTGDRASAVPSS